MRRTLLLAFLASSTLWASAPTFGAQPSLGPPPPASSLLSEGFVLIGEEKGVKVYRREERPGIELAAEGRFDAAPERVHRLLIDYPSHPRWLHRLKETRVLGRSDTSLAVYQRLGLPVLDDRDFSLNVTWGADSHVRWVRFAVANEGGPKPVRGVVRVTAQQGCWRLEPLDGGLATRAVYRFHMELGGSFPSWMGRSLAMSEIPELFEGITGQLPSYQDLEAGRASAQGPALAKSIPLNKQ